ncbi:MAG: DUF1731 domain-containing protein [Acidimicrobiia bacterium]|nr:DUF1731 domain-containing protein [Acidimicrobiia bacterium]
MRTDPALALTGRRCLPKRLIHAGFDFDHPTFADTISDLVGERPSSPSISRSGFEARQ